MFRNRNCWTASSLARTATLLAGGALGLGLLTAANVANAATPCEVPTTPYPTIQDAVNDTSCTTIDVAPNFTSSGSINIDRTLTLNGAQAGVDARSRSGGESLLTAASGQPAITIDAPNVVVDGFTVMTPTNPAPSGSVYGIVVKGTASGSVITNNIFSNIASTGNNATAQAIYVANGSDGVEISHNLIDNVSSPGSAKGVFVGYSASTDPSVGVVINSNQIKDISSTNSGAYGVLVNNGNGSTSNYGLVIGDNDISGLSSNTGWVHAVGIEADAPNVTVTGNTFSDLTADSPDVVAVWFESEDTSYGSARVNGNNFNFGRRPSVYGIEVDSTLSVGSVDGTCNYWGSASGPNLASASQDSGHGALVSTGVTFDPWSKNAAPQGPCVPNEHSSSDGHDGPPHSTPADFNSNAGLPPQAHHHGR